MQWDVDTAAFTIELRNQKVINRAGLQRFYGMLSARFPNENNEKRRGWGNLVSKSYGGFINSVFQSIH